MSLGAIAAVGAVIGMVGGFANAFAMQSEYNETLAELINKRQMLDEQYDLKKQQINEVAKESVAELDANIGEENLARGITAGSSAKNMVDQQRLANMQMAELQVQAAEAKGAAVQDVALSGTRLMRDAEGNVYNAGAYSTIRAATRAEDQAKAQIQINTRQSFASAVANYTDSSLRMESYKRRIATTKSQLERDLASLDLNYRQSRFELTSDIDYMESSSGERQLTLSMLGAIFGGTANGLSSSLKLYSTGKDYKLWD